MLAKRIFDIFISFFLLIILFPFLLLVSLLVSLDGGSVFFVQKRVGLRGKLFNIYKFRSMKADGCSQTLLTIGRDKRITRLGLFLRHFKIDELPQLFNVLLGDMSLVGPRPEVPKYVDYYPDNVRDIVLAVRPGITCPSSVEFIRESHSLAKAADPEYYYIHTILPAKLLGYVEYVETMSLAGDLKCLISTFCSVFI